MSRFYMTMNGGKSGSETLTRRAYSRAYATVASWNGSVRVEPYVDVNDRDMVRVVRRPWEGSGGPTVILYDGPFDMSDPNYTTDLSEKENTP